MSGQNPVQDQCQALIESHHKAIQGASGADPYEVDIPQKYYVAPQVFDAFIALATSGEIKIKEIINAVDQPRILKGVELNPGTVIIHERSPWIPSTTTSSQQWERPQN